MVTQVKQAIDQSRLIVIVRRLYGEPLLQLARAMEKGGIKLMEVTFDQSDPDGLRKTAQAIDMLCADLGDRMQFGAGTVMNPAQVVSAKEAGARYIISPNTSQRVITLSKELGLVSIPGAMTPSEMVAADEMGADYIKVFPVCDLGLGYIKNIRAPLSHLKLFATGGVSEENFAEHLAAGFCGAGVSGRLTDKELVERGDFEELQRRAGVFSKIAAVKGM